MKKLIVTLLFCALFLVSKAQETQNASVEKSIFGVQIGFLGVWVNNEARLSDKFALRSEIGFNAGILNNDFFMAPVITLEPKFYYNLNKRVTKSKDISANSGNFLSLKTSYHPDWFVVASNNVNISNQISVVPTWGIRRNIGKHFNYELGAGAGWLHEFSETVNGYTFDADNFFTININARIGYRF